MNEEEINRLKQSLKKQDSEIVLLKKQREVPLSFICMKPFIFN